MATIPPSKDPMMIDPMKVPKIVPTPPKTEVPPTNTDARVRRRYPSPRDGHRYVTSRLAMIPAREVGGDYYDIIETPKGDKWVTIGDVSGHGVDSGLIMMMAQTSILSKVNDNGSCGPSDMLESINGIIRENISRLGSDHYMTMMAMRLNQSEMTLAGKHQDLIIYRSALNKTETITIPGTWLGITDDIKTSLTELTIEINTGDIVLLFTDGITEAANAGGEMFSQERLAQALNKYADLPVGKLRDKIIEEVMSFQEEQLDDMTLVVIKK